MNVTATLGVELAPGATPDEVKAAMDLTSLSADDPIGLLSNDPDKFFGRTTKVNTLSRQSASLLFTGSGMNALPKHHAVQDIKRLKDMDSRWA